MGYNSYSSLPTNTKFLYLLNADDLNSSNIPQDAFVVYQGHHGDNGASYANVVLPGAAYTEKSGTYVNTEGRTQVTRAAVAPPGAAREDWKIIRAISEVIGKTLPYDHLIELRERLAEISPSFASYDMVELKGFSKIGLAQLLENKDNESSKTSNQKLFTVPIQDYYFTDPISRASRTMAKCSVAFTLGKWKEIKKEQQIAV